MIGPRRDERVVAVRPRSAVRSVGLDLGATAVRAAVLTVDPRNSGVFVRRLGSVPLPVGAIDRGVIREPGEVTAALRRLVTENGLLGCQVVLGINTPQVVVRSPHRSGTAAGNSRKVVPFRVRDVLPVPCAGPVLEFSPLPGVRRLPGGEDAPPADGLLTAAPRTAVLSAIQAVQDAGLTVTRVDLSSFGMLRSIATPGTVVEALVDVGSDLTTIVIHRHGVPHVVRVVPFGGQQLTDRVADALGISRQHAEDAKRSVGVVGDSAPALQIRDELRPLASEVRSSVQFFATTVGSAVGQVLVTGGTSALPGLLDWLATELGTPVGIAAPLRHLTGWVLDGPMHPDAAAGAATSAVSVGLALGIAS